MFAETGGKEFSVQQGEQRNLNAFKCVVSRNYRISKQNMRVRFKSVWWVCVKIQTHQLKNVQHMFSGERANHKLRHM